MNHYCQVAVRMPGQQSILTYLPPSQLPVDVTLTTGDLVEVPLGRRTSKGVVVNREMSEAELPSDIPREKIKNIIGQVDHEFSLSAKELALYQWMAKYYHYSLGLLVFDCLPKILKRPRSVEFLEGQGLALEHELNSVQAEMYTSIQAHLPEGFSKHLLHGVTGSGKTLVYLNLMLQVLKEDKSVLFLLPEINLTPQFMETFQKYLPCPILPYHSGLTPSEKNHVWRKLKNDDGPVVVMGVRSSVFLPMEKLGLVIVDEEHDSSFKQTDRCPYHARDVAIKKAQLSNCPIILGSATPCLENYRAFKLQAGGHYYEMRERVGEGELPEIEMVDMRPDQSARKNSEADFWPLATKSIEEIKQALEKGEQVLVFINRLGFANFIQCRACGHKFVDPNSQTPLRYFKRKNMLISAHSDFQIPLPEICPECENMNLLQKGFGTEKVQEVLQELFSDKRVERFDRDDISNFKKLRQRLDEFHSGKVDILVGTQMLSKGHNFRNVNLVVVLGIDSQLNFPDFRAEEKTYQLLTQVVGRAGRFGKNAKVLVQSLAPENDVFRYVVTHSFDGFYDREVEIRQLTDFPPFSRMAIIYLNSKHRERLTAKAGQIARSLEKFIQHHGFDCHILGPCPAMLEMRMNQYTWYIAIRSHDINALHQTLSFFERQVSVGPGISPKIDVDPLQIV